MVRRKKIDSLESFWGDEYLTMKPGLGRIRRFLKVLGNPQEQYKAVHIAGTNGKGSTARMIADSLQGCGYKTGLYTSPHLNDIRERVQINGTMISKSKWQKLVSSNIRKAKKARLTYFEFITAIAFLHFSEEKIDFAVIETGLGGRFDATNIINHPIVTVITDVDYDHEKLLGCKLDKIAFEKAGIIKQDIPVVSGVKRPIAFRVIQSEAKRKNAPINHLGKSFFCKSIITNWKKARQKFVYCSKAGKQDVVLSALGDYQAKNAALVLKALEIIKQNGFSISDVKVRKALLISRWAGRFDVRKVNFGKNKITVVLDGAHNPGGMQAFLSSWKKSPWGKRKTDILYGAMKDKKIESIVPSLAPYVRNVFLMPLKTQRAESPEQLGKIWQRYVKVSQVKNINSFEGIKSYMKNNQTLLACGSLYLAGSVLGSITSREKRHG